MKEFSTETTINAPADKVWSILTDTAKWPEWDPFCDKIPDMTDAFAAGLKKRAEAS